MLEKSAKRWIRRLLMNDISGSSPNPVAAVRNAYRSRIQYDKAHYKNVSPGELEFDASGKRYIPVFEGTARDRLAAFKAKGQKPSVTKQRVYSHRNDAFRKAILNYVNNTSQHIPDTVKSRYMSLRDRQRKLYRIKNRILENAIDVKNNRIVFGKNVLRQYSTPNTYGITHHMADLDRSERANLLAREAFKNGLTEIPMPEDLQVGYRGHSGTRLLVGGPGIKHTDKDIAFMRNSVNSDKDRDLAETLLYESTAPLAGKGTRTRPSFRFEKAYVPDEPLFRQYYNIPDSVEGMDTTELIPAFRDKVFRAGYPGGTAHRRSVLEKAIERIKNNPEYNWALDDAEEMLDYVNGKVYNKTVKDHGFDWYTPNPVIGGDYAGTRRVVPIPHEEYAKRLKPAHDLSDEQVDAMLSKATDKRNKAINLQNRLQNQIHQQYESKYPFGSLDPDDIAGNILPQL